MSSNMAGKHALEAWSLVYLGSLYARRGDPQKGVQLMQRGVDLMHKARDQGAERKLLLMVAAMQHELGQLDDAIGSYSAATVLAREANDIKGEARIYRHVGSILQDKGDHRSALHSFKVAVQLSDQSGDKLGLISSSLLAGNAISQASKQAPEALSYWKQALRLCKDFGDTEVKKLLPLRSEALFRLINHYEQQRLYAVALPYRQELMEMMRLAGQPRGYATALLDVADVQARLGLLFEAAASFKEAVNLWHDFGDAINEATARAGLAGSLLHQGLLHDARVEANLARRLLEKSQPSSMSKESTASRAKALASAAELLARTGEVQGGQDLAKAALKMAGGRGGDQDLACLAGLALARSLLEAGDVEEARKQAAKALNHAISSQMYPQIYSGLELLADVALSTENLDKATEYFRKMASLSGKSGLAWTSGPALQRLAEIEEKRGNLQSAIKLHMDAVSLFGQQQPFRTHKSLSACARLYAQMGNSKASESFANMIKHLAHEDVKTGGSAVSKKS